jgi:hypothetical protein
LEEQGPRRRGAAPPDVGSLCARFFFLGWMEPDGDGDDVIWGTVGQAAAAAAADENCDGGWSAGPAHSAISADHFLSPAEAHLTFHIGCRFVVRMGLKDRNGIAYLQIFRLTSTRMAFEKYIPRPHCAL